MLCSSGSSQFLKFIGDFLWSAIPNKFNLILRFSSPPRHSPYGVVGFCFLITHIGLSSNFKVVFFLC